jgi:hypothetical protein
MIEDAVAGLLQEIAGVPRDQLRGIA